MFRKLGEVLKDVVERTEIRGGINKGKVITLWPRIVGERIAAHAYPYLFKAGTLFVATSSSVWAQELELMRKPLMEKMNECLGREVVKDIRLQARPPSRRGLGRAPQASSRPFGKREAGAAISSMELDEEVVCQIKERVKSIPDEKLQKTVLRAAILDEKLKAWRREQGLAEDVNHGAFLRRASR